MMSTQAQPSTLQETQVAIAVEEAKLISMRPNEAEGQRLASQRELQRLRSWERYLKLQTAESTTSATAYSRPGSSASNISSASSWGLNYPDISHDDHPLPALGMKRGAAHLGPEAADRLSKSRRSTPAPDHSATASLATTDTSDFENNDPLLQEIFGEDWRQDQRQNKVYMKVLDAKRKQEEEDHKFALALQQEMNQDGPTAPPASSVQPGSFRQSQFGSSGNLIKPQPMRPPPPPLPQIKTDHTSPLALRTLAAPSSSYLQSSQHPPTFVKSESSSKPRTTPWLDRESSSSARIGSGTRDSPISLDSSSQDSDLQFVSSTGRPQPTAYQPSGTSFSGFGTSDPLMTPYPAMPGGFPNGYDTLGVGGSSVYGINPTQQGSGQVPSPNDFSFSYPSNLDDMLPLPYDLSDRSGGHEAHIQAVIANIRPDEELSPEERVETPAELNVQLMPHQKTGLAWMLKMEQSTNKGGILADEMGLGKTIQALSLIVANKPQVGRPRPTLILAPVALMDQWRLEIKDRLKVQHRLKVLVFHGSTGRNQIKTWRMFQQYDIVITTYGSVAAEFKRLMAFRQRQKHDPNARPNEKERCLLLGDETKFHRVILDEAQNIKNRKTKSAIGTCYIASEFRWCLTGTPMQNSVDEYQSLLQFLRIAPYNSWEKYSKDISKPLKSSYGKERAMRALQALIRSTSLRRTKDSKIDGKPILTLPPKTTSEVRAEFSEDQENFYLSLENKTRIQFNRYLEANTIGRNYSSILVLLLRLRQACCHPHLITDVAISVGPVTSEKLMENAREIPKDVVARLKATEAFDCPVCLDAIINPKIALPCGHSICDECLAQWIDNAVSNGNGAENGGVVTCPSCRTKLDTTKTTDHNSFVKVHLPDSEMGKELLAQEQLVEEAESSDDDDSDTDDDDDEDDGDSESLKDFIVDDEDEVEFDTPEDEEEEANNSNVKPVVDSDFQTPLSTSNKKRKKSNKAKGKRKVKDEHAMKSLGDLRKEGLKNKAAKAAYLKRLSKRFVSSAKIDETLRILERIHRDDPTDKTLIFTSFTTFLDLLEVPLRKHAHLKDYMRYDGSMTTKDRTAAVHHFNTEPNCKMMLISLKAGNAGLNLTKANHVIVLDPHWNYYVEAQAVDRAHRLGQTKPVQVYRVLVSSEDEAKYPTGTVEDRILQLQEKKRLLVEAALNEEESRSIARLGRQELGYLFVSAFSMMNRWLIHC